MFNTKKSSAGGSISEKNQAVDELVPGAGRPEDRTSSMDVSTTIVAPRSWVSPRGLSKYIQAIGAATTGPMQRSAELSHGSMPFSE